MRIILCFFSPICLLPIIIYKVAYFFKHKKLEGQTTEEKKFSEQPTHNDSKPKEFKTHDMEINESIMKVKEAPRIEEKPKTPCPNCGTGNGLNAKRCFNYGTALENKE